MKNEKEIVTYENLLTIEEGNSLETMVPVSEFEIFSCPRTNDMKIYTGNEVFVRKTVAEKLVMVNSALSWELGDVVKLTRGKFKGKKLEIVVTYGYRHPEIQQRYFNERLASNDVYYFQLEYKLPEKELHGLVHNLIAVPDVAGHPTGGAVDVTLYANGIELDMGTKIADFSKPELIPTFSPHITPEQLENRLVLRAHMLSQGFAPFNGEWWHFSYGDKEWAYWYYQKKSIYQQIEFTFKNVNH